MNSDQAISDFAACAEPVPQHFVCPVDPDHDSFRCTHRETVAHLFNGEGDFIEELSNSYESEGYEGDVWCRVCDRNGIETVVVGEPL